MPSFDLVIYSRGKRSYLFDASYFKYYVFYVGVPPPLYADEPVDAKILIVHLYLQISSSFLLRATITKLYVVYYKLEALLLYF